ncbi:MAG: glycoside hydrolase family protein, partial [Bryobacterales bacterium]|nr:glycoside hydrolase family protein [Bryobacterales bacterium]
SVEDARLPEVALFDWVRYYRPTSAPVPLLTDLDLGTQLQPLPASARFSDPDHYIWCGSLIRGDDRKYHLFYSRWPRKLGHNAWVTHSEIAHAVADSPTGPFRHVAVTLPPRGKQHWDGLTTHNPTVLRAGGRYYLYYMGNTGDGQPMRTLNWTHRNNQRIGVAVAESPEGPWQRFDSPVLDVSTDPDAPDSLMTSNPSVARRPDGGFLMVYKAVGRKRPMPFGGPVVHLTATADSPTGPFRKQLKPIFLAPKIDFPAEDPFIWHDPSASRYYAVVKDNAGHFTGAGKSLALWESKDGLAWGLSAHPLVSKIEVTWADGRTQKLNSLERPQLLFAPDGRPAVLLAAVDETADRPHSYNLQIPLGRK